jgi:hypothetical protein
MMEKITLPNDVLLDEVARLVAEGGAVALMTKGASMLPFIVGGRDSVVLVRPEELFPGMIVLAYVQGGRYVLHRILSVDGTKVVLMGDGNIKGVEVCAPADVKAVAVRISKPSGEVDCLSKRHLRQAAIWKTLLPVRRWILAVYRRLFI